MRRLALVLIAALAFAACGDDGGDLDAYVADVRDSAADMTAWSDEEIVETGRSFCGDELTINEHLDTLLGAFEAGAMEEKAFQQGFSMAHAAGEHLCPSERGDF